jgi:hypothetical protein
MQPTLELRVSLSAINYCHQATGPSELNILNSTSA